MTPNERRAIRAREATVEAAVNLLKRKRGFAAAQYQAMTRGRDFLNGLTEKDKQLASPQRLGAVLRLLDIRAESYLPLVDDMDSQEAFTTLLTSFADKAWQEYTGYPPFIARPMADNPSYQSIKDRVERWVAGGYKRVDEREKAIQERPAAGAAPELDDSGGPTVFISYSWDSEEHKGWARSLAERLVAAGITAVIDQTHLKLGARLPQFMECSVRECQRVLVICTEEYRERFDGRRGGVGYEGQIITGEMVNQFGQNKFIPVLRSGDWVSAIPTALAGVHGVDLREDSPEEYQRLIDGVRSTE